MPHARKPKTTPKRPAKGGRRPAVKNEAKVVAAAVSAAVHATEKPRSRSAARKAKHSRKGALGGINPEVACWSQMMLQPDVCLTDTNVKRLARLPDGNSSAVLSCSGTVDALRLPVGSVALVYGVPVGEALRYSWLDTSSVDPGSTNPIVGVIRTLPPCAGFTLVVPQTWITAAGMPPLHSPFSILPEYGNSTSAAGSGSSASPWFSAMVLGGTPHGVNWDTHYKLYNPVFAAQTQNSGDARVGHRYMPLAEWIFSILTVTTGNAPLVNSVYGAMTDPSVIQIIPHALTEGAAAFTMCCNVDAQGAVKETDPAALPTVAVHQEQRACPARFNVMDTYWQGNPNYLTQCTVHGFSTILGPGGLFGFETAFSAPDGDNYSVDATYQLYLQMVAGWFIDVCCVMPNEARQFTDKYQVMNLGLSGESGFHLCSDGAEDVPEFQPLGNPNNAFLTSAMFPAPSSTPSGGLEMRLRKAMDRVEAEDLFGMVDALKQALSATITLGTPWTPGARDADLTREYLPHVQRLTFGLVYNNSTQAETFVAANVAAFQFQCNRGMGLEERPTTDQRTAVRAAYRAIRTHPVLVGPHSFADWFKTLKEGVLGVGREIASVGSEVGRSMWLGAKMVGKHAAASSMIRAGGRMLGSMAADEAALGALMLV